MTKTNSSLPGRHNSMRYILADYSDPGVYFITLCTKNRLPLFGNIVNDTMRCSHFGDILWKIWRSLPERFPQIDVDTAIVMPDHFHGIIIIHEYHKVIPNFEMNCRINTAFSDFCTKNDSILLESDESHQQLPRRKMTLPLVVGYFKMNSAKEINLLCRTPGRQVWQRGFFDRILRDDQDYDTLSEYILTNPLRWGLDKD